MKTTRNFNTVFDALYSMLDNDVWTYRSNGNAIPAINITEVESQYEMEFAVPGMTKEDFKIQLDTENNLVVSMEKAPKSTPEKRYLRQGFRASAFRQSIVLPDDVNREGISARVENGILYIVLPKLAPEVVKPEVRTIGIA